MKFLLFAFFVGLVSTQFTCPNEFTYNPDLNTCLSSWNFFSSWSSANFYCQYYGGNLVSIHNSQQNMLTARIENNRTKDNRGWLGLTKRNGTWAWTDGTPFNYQNFQGNQTKDCAYLDSQDYLWKTADCSVDLPFMCFAPPTISNGTTQASNMTTTTLTSNMTTTTTTSSPLTCLPPNQQNLYNCKQGWQYFTQTMKQYMVVRQIDLNTTAEAFCVSQGGHLASVHSQAESDFITNLCCPSSCGFYSPELESYAAYLVGGIQVNMQPTWTDGTAFDFQANTCFDARSPSEVLHIAAFTGCNECGAPGTWIWETDVVPYVVCKK